MWEAIFSWLSTAVSSSTVIALCSLAISLLTLWWNYAEPFKPRASLADIVHVPPRLQGHPFRYLYVPLNFTNRGARAGLIEGMLLKVILPDKSERYLEPVLSREHHGDAPNEDYFSTGKGGMLFPQVYLERHGQKVIGMLFKPALPIDRDWFTEGEVTVMVLAKPDSIHLYIEIGSFTFRFSPELIAAIADSADTRLSVLLEDIKIRDVRRKLLGRADQKDSFAGTTGEGQLPDSVSALFRRSAVGLEKL